MAFGGDTPESYYDEGLTASMKGDVAAAIAHFERVLQMNPDYAAAQHQLGKCYQRLGDFDRAVAYLQKAVDAKPANHAMRVDLGFALLDKGECAKARQVFEQALLAKADAYRAQLGLAQCAFAEGQWGAALTLAQATLTMLSGDHLGVLFLIGRSALQTGDNLLAKEYLNRADTLIEKLIESNEGQPEGYFMRGELNFAQGYLDKALDNYRAAEDRIDPKKHYAVYGEHFTLVDALAKRGLCYQRLGSLERAKDTGGQILKLDPAHKIGNMLAAIET